MKRINIFTISALLTVIALIASPFPTTARKKTPVRPAPRGQWTEQQAWDWEKKVGEIHGFNAPSAAYPGQSRAEILRKASEYGLNSVRTWIQGSTAQEQIDFIRTFAEEAAQFGMTVSPVLSIQNQYYNRPDEEQALKECEETIRQIVRAFATDERIIFWDIWNEPRYRADEANTYRNMDWIEKMVLWCRDEGIIQPITSSIIWETCFDTDTVSRAWKRRAEVEAMMDIHNFHDYQAAENMGRDLEVTLQKVRSISNRPMVCTECMTRVYGSGVFRTLGAFAREHVHFYLWGMYNSDANWSVKWSRSTYDPFEPMFHDFLWADGDMYDAREYEIIKNFHFLAPGQADPDPGIPVTERWSQERAWKWVVGGPLTGSAIKGMWPSSAPEKYNSIRIPVHYNHWRYERFGFFHNFDEWVNWASQKGMTILPTLVTDDVLDISDEDLAEYVRDVIAHYYDNPTIRGWDIYYHPGEKATDRKRVEGLVDLLFTYARNQYPNQPVFMTPYVSVKPFDSDFDYRASLIHGRIRGWDQLAYGGVSDADLVWKIWSLSDVTAFSTEQPAPEAGWLLSICYRFGRPIFCTSFSGKGQQQKDMLDLFAKSHVYWYTGDDVPEEDIANFKFIPIKTQH